MVWNNNNNYKKAIIMNVIVEKAGPNCVVVN